MRRDDGFNFCGGQGLHHDDATVREEKKSTGSVSTMFLVGTGVNLWPEIRQFLYFADQFALV